ncbi:hypothetical protein TNCV_4661561 [Trichonephila clavipes]|uniref:Uncharacterized protein n=1 Tax=Trichonephila clavipes TaxID=2585209 RepID=A0A8X6SCQ3_TRICX|nr:hypothetical protein TNCV_4661561 [Trichonephila clavipes]
MGNSYDDPDQDNGTKLLNCIVIDPGQSTMGQMRDAYQALNRLIAAAVPKLPSYRANQPICKINPFVLPVTLTLNSVLPSTVTRLLTSILLIARFPRHA